MISSLGHKYNILGHILLLICSYGWYIMVAIGVGTLGVK